MNRQFNNFENVSMDQRIKEIHIENEAKRIYAVTKREDQSANWYEAIENLKIFPQHQYHMGGVYNVRSDDYDLGLIRSGIMITNMRWTMNWYYCREMFERDIFVHYNNYHGGDRFGFFYSPSAFEQEVRVANFIRDVELNKLQLEELTTFMRTSRGFIYIRPSSFWTCCQIRFSLFTILIKAGRNYYFNTIDDVLWSHPYSACTMPAINLFFNGRRNYTGTIPNWQYKWVRHYSGVSESEIHTLN